MNALEKHVSDVKQRFVNIDQAIFDFQARKAQLAAEIEALGDDFTLAAVQNTTTLRLEYQEIDKALARAQTRRNELVSEMPISALSAAVRQCSEEVSAEYEVAANEIWDQCTQLRQRVKDLRKKDSQARDALREIVRELRPFYPAEAIESHRFSSPLLPLIKDHNDANAALIRRIIDY